MQNSKARIIYPHLQYSAVEQNNAFQQQRKRWIAGQFAMIKKYGLPMLGQGIYKMDLSQIDFACAIFQLPRSFLMIFCLGLSCISFIFPGLSPISFEIWLVLFILFLGYAMLGFYLIGVPIKLSKILKPAMNLISGVFKTTFIQFFSKENIQWESLRKKDKR